VPEGKAISVSEQGKAAGVQLAVSFSFCDSSKGLPRLSLSLLFPSSLVDLSGAVGGEAKEGVRNG